MKMNEIITESVVPASSEAVEIIAKKLEEFLEEPVDATKLEVYTEHYADSQDYAIKYGDEYFMWNSVNAEGDDLQFGFEEVEFKTWPPRT